MVGRTGWNKEDETVMYSLDTIVYDRDLVLDGSYDIPDDGAKLLSGKIYEIGYERDISDGTKKAEHTVVLKVNGNLTIQSGVTLTSILGDAGGPKGLIIYCTGTLRNDGEISMTRKRCLG